MRPRRPATARITASGLLVWILWRAPSTAFSESAVLGVALISAVENPWISRSKTKKGRFLRLPCAYGGRTISGPVGITLI